jgi:hypothetical protein
LAILTPCRSSVSTLSANGGGWYRFGLQRL